MTFFISKRRQLFFIDVGLQKQPSLTFQRNKLRQTKQIQTNMFLLIGIFLGTEIRVTYIFLFK